MSKHVPFPSHVAASRPWLTVKPVGPPPDSHGDIGVADMQCGRDPNTGYGVWYAHFKPTEQELAWLNAGGTIEMHQLGAAPQPFAVSCWPPEPGTEVPA